MPNFFGDKNRLLVIRADDLALAVYKATYGAIIDASLAKNSISLSFVPPFSRVFHGREQKTKLKIHLTKQ